MFFFFKQKTAYEMRISDWSSDVCSSDLLKNTLVPVITITGLQLGSIIAFSLITEQVFQWPGMGLLFIQAIGAVDIPVMAAYLMLLGFFFVVINLGVDLLYYAVDPRLRAAQTVAAGHQ